MPQDSGGHSTYSPAAGLWNRDSRQLGTGLPESLEQGFRTSWNRALDILKQGFRTSWNRASRHLGTGLPDILEQGFRTSWNRNLGQLCSGLLDSLEQGFRIAWSRASSSFLTWLPDSQAFIHINLKHGIWQHETGLLISLGKSSRTAWNSALGQLWKVLRTDLKGLPAVSLG